jgi:hypothetical protein
MRKVRYIEVDAAWWSDTPHSAPEAGPLFDALLSDGWKTVKGKRRGLLVRRFGSTTEYRAAVASARFKAAEYLVEPRQIAS